MRSISAYGYAGGRKKEWHERGQQECKAFSFFLLLSPSQKVSLWSDTWNFEFTCQHQPSRLWLLGEVRVFFLSLSLSPGSNQRVCGWWLWRGGGISLVRGVDLQLNYFSSFRQTPPARPPCSKSHHFISRGEMRKCGISFIFEIWKYLFVFICS